MTLILLIQDQMNIESTSRGMRKWCAEYRLRFRPYAQLKAEVDEYMAGYDTVESKRRAESRKRSRQPDADGWITVTKSGRRPVPAATTAGAVTAVSTTTKQRKRKANQPTLAFYNFQAKQSKLQHLADLRQKFDDDKKRLTAAKAARKFKPH